MNIVQKLTYCHIKSNKKRALVTIFGIIVSVAMVTAVFTSSFSFMRFMQDIDINHDGNWYSQFTECSMDDASKLLKNEDVDSVSIQKYNSYIDVDKTSKNSKKQTGFISVNKTTYDNFFIELSKGEYPKDSSEIIVTDKFIEDNKLNWKVGQNVTLDEFVTDENGQNTEEFNTYKLVGTISANNSTTSQQGVITTIDSDYKGKDLTLFVLNTKLNNHIWDTTKSDAKSIGRTDCDNHNIELFQYAGIFQDNALLIAIGGFVGIILALILIASVMMIYNSFAVSFQQRSRYLGMLASIGATKSQKRVSIYYEGFLLGLIGIPIGVVAGFVGILVTFKCLSQTVLGTLAIETNVELTAKINWVVILISVVISALTIFISALIPALKASKTSAIDAIRQNNTVKVKARRLKTSKLVGKVFGFDGQLGMKNFKRNGRRSRTITSALALSVILFLSVTSFTDSFTQLFSSNFGGTSCDIFITCSDKDANGFIDELDKNGKVDSYNYYSMDAISIDNVKSIESKEAKKYDNDFDFSNLMVVGADEKSFNEYCKKIGLDSDDYKDNNSCILVNTANLVGIDDKRQISLKPYANAQGKSFDSKYEAMDNQGNITDTKKSSITISAVTTEQFGEEMLQLSSAYIVIPYENCKNIMFKDSMKPCFSIYAEDHAGAFSIIEQYLDDNGIDYNGYDLTEQLATMRGIMTVVDVFVYGFITLITLISVTNIINTISTSMDERRREFAMIKSVGQTPKSFKKMIYLESIYYGLKALLWGMPISIGVNYLMYRALSRSYDFGYSVNLIYYLIAIVAVFLIIGIALLYSTSKIKKDNIIETLKNDDI